MTIEYIKSNQNSWIENDNKVYKKRKCKFMNLKWLKNKAKEIKIHEFEMT